MNIGNLGVSLNAYRSPGNAVSRFVSGTKGGFWSYRRAQTLAQVSDGSTPVTANGDPIGYVSLATKGTVEPINWTQLSGSRATWQGTYALFDGLDDSYIVSSNGLEIFRNVTEASVGFRFSIENVASAPGLFSWSHGGSGGAVRVSVQVAATGAINLAYRRLDGDGATVASSATAAVSNGNTYTLLVSLNYGAGGAGAVRGWLDGVSVINASMSGTGATSNTASVAARHGALLGSTNFLSGKVESIFAANKIITDGEVSGLTAAMSS